MQVTMIAGNVGKDAELRSTQSGDKVLGFSVAVENGKDKNGNRRASTWYRCSVWGQRAESLQRHIKRGTKLALTGRVGVNVYKGDGFLTLTVNELTFMSKAQKECGEDRPRHDDSKRNDIDDEIPF